LQGSAIVSTLTMMHETGQREQLQSSRQSGRPRPGSKGTGDMRWTDRAQLWNCH